MIGSRKPASRKMIPWKMPTEIAEKMQPLPSADVMIMTMTASITVLANRTEGSLSRRSLIEPMTAMAPMQTVRDAVTKPSTNRVSPPLPVFCWSQCPKRSMRSSRSMASPMTAPPMRLASIQFVPTSVTPPSAPICSISLTVPVKPRNITATAQAIMMAFWKRSDISRPHPSPKSPPPTMPNTFAKTPIPGNKKFPPF